MKNVYVIGVFDLFHVGHLNLLRRARSLGGKLIVAVNGDSLVADYKRKPIISEQNRLAIIESLSIVDECFVINKYDNSKELINYKIDIIVHGDDWEEQSYLRQIGINNEFLLSNGIEMKLLSYTSGISTSDLIKTIRCDDI